MNTIFDWCVVLLEWLAKYTGTTYQIVNVLIFCIIWPLITVGLLIVVIVQHKCINQRR